MSKHNAVKDIKAISEVEVTVLEDIVGHFSRIDKGTKTQATAWDNAKYTVEVPGRDVKIWSAPGQLKVGKTLKKY